MVQKPWNLRPRKALFSKAAPVGPKSGELQEAEVAVAGGGHQSENPNQQPPKSMRLRGLSESQQCSEKKEKRKFWIALSRDEIEEDIFVMTGSRPARRPRKRPKNVQKQLDAVFPGLWLVGFTADAYRVIDTPAKRLPYIVGGQSSIICKSLFDTGLIHCLLPCSGRAVFFIRLFFNQDKPMMRLRLERGYVENECFLV